MKCKQCDPPLTFVQTNSPMNSFGVVLDFRRWGSVHSPKIMDRLETQFIAPNRFASVSAFREVYFASTTYVVLSLFSTQ